MSIQKKSLISTLKTAKKANIASQVEGVNSRPESQISKRMALPSHAVSTKSVSKRSVSKRSVSKRSISKRRMQ